MKTIESKIKSRTDYIVITEDQYSDYAKKHFGIERETLDNIGKVNKELTNALIKKVVRTCTEKKSGLCVGVIHSPTLITTSINFDNVETRLGVATKFNYGKEYAELVDTLFDYKRAKNRLESSKNPEVQILGDNGFTTIDYVEMLEKAKSDFNELFLSNLKDGEAVVESCEYTVSRF